MTGAGREGFSLAEALVVAVLGAFLLAALYGTVASSSRTVTLEDAWARRGGNLRAGTTVLFRDLRELSPRDGDLVRAGPEGLQIRAPGRLALVCDVVRRGDEPTVRARQIGPPLEEGDSVRVLFDGDTSLSADDEWYTAVVARVASGPSCGPRDTALDLTLLGLPEEANRDALVPGAPLRSFVNVTYEGASREGAWHLTRAVGDGPSRLLLGPLDPEAGVRFSYLDRSGAPAEDPSRVVQIVVALRGAESDRSGSRPDTLTARIHVRN